MEQVIALDDPRRDDIHAVLERHLAFMHATSPPEDVHALDVDELCAPDVAFYSLRRDGVLFAIGALKELDASHGEVKSMHTVGTERRQGVGRTMLDHLLAVARARGYSRVSLETGSMDEFAGARAMYARAGFVECEPFGDYAPSANSTFMTLDLHAMR